MNTKKYFTLPSDMNGKMQLAASFVAIVLLAISFSATGGLLGTPNDFIHVLAPFEIQGAGDFAYWASLTPIVLTLLFFSAVISNRLTKTIAGPITAFLFYSSAIVLALSSYFRIASMALDYVAVTPLAGTAEVATFMQYGVLAMPLVIVICTLVFHRISQFCWVEDHPALSWCLFVAAMLFLGAFAPAAVFLIYLVALWVVFVAIGMLALAVGIPLICFAIANGAAGNF